MEDAQKLVAHGLEAATAGRVKGLLKALGQSQAGEKAELAERLRLFVEGAALSAPRREPNPASLKVGELRKELAKRGLPCDTSIETRDALLRRLIDALKREAQPNAGASGADRPTTEPDDGGAPASGEGRDITLAKRVLELAETGEDAAILSLAGAPVSRDSTVAAMRKAYLAVSRSVHPDKLRNFADATKAFQALVGAFERLSQPEVVGAGEASRRSGAVAATAIARSNANCFRTKVRCPRCKVEWGQPCDGVEKWCYSVLMQGVKCYTCSTCLLDFGCMTALHSCPHCNGPFEFAPADYHRQVTCGSARCTRPFGFHLFVMPPRAEAELRAEVKAAAERRLRVVEAARARTARGAARARAAAGADGGGGGGGGASGERAEAEAAFVRGLRDECPRCGWAPSAGEAQRDDLVEHLRSCTDAKAHAAHRKRKAAADARDDARAAGRHKQEEAMTHAAWQLLGGQASQMWMLTDEQLRARCLEAGVEAAGEQALTRTERIAALARRAAEADGARMLTNGGGSVAPPRGRRGGSAACAPSASSLPDNLHSLSLQQLRDVCAAHGFVPKARGKDAVIAELEKRRFAGSDEVLLLE